MNRFTCSKPWANAKGFLKSVEGELLHVKNMQQITPVDHYFISSIKYPDANVFYTGCKPNIGNMPDEVFTENQGKLSSLKMLTDPFRLSGV